MSISSKAVRSAFEYYQYRLKGWDIIRNLRLGADIRLAQCAQNGQYETALDELCAELLKFRHLGRQGLEEMYKELGKSQG